MIRIRVERLIAGDVVLYGNSALSDPVDREVRPPDPLMEHDHRPSSLRATVERDRVLQAIRLV